MTITPSPLFQPQFVAAVPTALVFAPKGSTVVPNNFTYQILTCHVVNTGGGAPVSLSLWRVPAGSTADAEHVGVPATVTIPVGSSGVPWFTVEVLMGAVLGPGDSIWASAGGSSVLSISADGVVIQ